MPFERFYRLEAKWGRTRRVLLNTHEDLPKFRNESPRTEASVLSYRMQRPQVGYLECDSMFPSLAV